MGIQTSLGRRLRGGSALSGIRSIRMEGNQPTDLAGMIAEVNKTFQAFKDEQNKVVADLKKGIADGAQNEKVDKINAEITKLQQAIDESNQLIAALKVGGAGDSKETPDQKAYKQAFNRFFRKGDEPANMRELEVKATAYTGSDPDGGYTVTPEIEAGIDRVLTLNSAMRQIATVRSVGSAVYKKIVNLGGTTSGWVGEQDGRPNTATSQLSELAFPTMELYANPMATQGMLDDSNLDIAGWISDEVNLEFANQEGAAWISGNGTSQPRGLMSYPMIADADYAWGKFGFIVTGAAADLTADGSDPLDPLLDVQDALKTGYQNGASWLMHRNTGTRIRKVKDSTGNYIWQPSIVAGQPATLFAKPVVTDDYMPKLGANAFPIAYGDFKRGYLILDRIGIRVLRDPYSNKPYVQFYTTKRVGGGVQNFEAIKFLKCST